MADRGRIFSEDAYALGKMLDHSAWQILQPRLPRKITGSDIDSTDFLHDNITVFDNWKYAILVEFSRHERYWSDIKFGSRVIYEGLLVGAPRVAVICHHNIDPEVGKKICSRTDIDSFQPMILDHDIIICELYEGNERWQKFILSWFKNPMRIRRWLIGESISRRKRF